MTKVKNILILAGLIFLYSCEDEFDNPVLTISGNPEITAPTGGSSYVMEEETLTSQFAEFQWSSADYGFDAGVSYTLEMDLASGGFTEPVILGKVNNKSFSVDNAKVNGIMLTKDAPLNIVTDVSFRVIASVSPDVEDLISSPLTVSVLPFAAEIEYPRLYVPGDYQGWDPSNETTVIYSIESNSDYEGFVYMSEPTSMYKFTEGPNWDVNYGDDGADGTLDSGGADISTTEGAGMYRLAVDLDALTFSQEKTDWGLIGSATPTGWDSDTDLTYDPVTNTSFITLDLVEGAIKFRANDDWPINLGDTGADLIMEYGGDDIVIDAAGNYTIELILNKAAYSYNIVKN